MNKHVISLGLALVLSTTVFGQKKEVKAAEKAIAKGNYSEAIESLKEAQALNILEENDKWKLRYYNNLGLAYRGADEGIGQPIENLRKAGEFFNEALKIDDANLDADSGLFSVRSAILDAAINDQKNQKFKEAAQKLYESYNLDRTDTIHLYYAAGNAVNAKEYETALSYYNQLIDMGYDGATTQYFAVNIETEQLESFGSDKSFRDISVKTGKYEAPEDRETVSKRGEIAKNISLIYIQTDQSDKAIESIELAKKENPNDLGLMQAEADLYYQLADFNKYKDLMEQIVQMDPENPILYFNLGITAEKLGDVETSVNYYKQAIELDPSMVNAYINIAASILQQERPIVDEMNSLGMSAADNKRYKELEKQKEQFYRDALPYLKKAVELDDTNLGALRTIMNIYYQTGEDAKAKEIKEKIDSLK
jgi:tetratricopeptide (TPR) repeat protein